MRPAASVAGPGRALLPGRDLGLWIVVALSLGYALGHLGWYLGTPLGQVPVLDEKENILLATQIASGQLPAEPFYRAMGYPLLLAGFLRSGIPPAQLPAVALAFGAVLHALNALLVGLLAKRLFPDSRAVWLAAAFCGFNPVLLHYAVSVLDATLGTTFFLFGCLAFFGSRFPESASSPTPSISPLSSALRPLSFGLFWALAALTRPQFLPVCVILPLIYWLRGRSLSAFLQGGAALGVVAALFLVQGVWSQQVSGQFRVMPWQGTYNLWAANKPGANGRYFVQSVFLASNVAQENPTKLETFDLYAQETGSPSRDIDTVNRYWRTRFVQYVTSHPAEWSALLFRKTYALLNNWEQYNNKTYAFHKARSPWLRWNPLGWGALLLCALPGGWLLLRRSPRDATAFFVIAVVYALGVILTLVSARFRLPEVTLLAVLAAGTFSARSALAAMPRAPLIIALVLLTAIAGSSFFDVRNERTFLQDHILMARAAQRTGDDQTALEEARAAATLVPDQPEAAELLLTSWFNLALEKSLAPDATVVAAAKVAARDPDRLAPPTTAIAGIVLLKASGHAEAEKLWRSRSYPELLAALQLSGLADETEKIRWETLSPQANDSLLVRLARQAPAERPAAWSSLFSTRQP